LEINKNIGTLPLRFEGMSKNGAKVKSYILGKRRRAEAV
jgi:hypothetical protein